MQHTAVDVDAMLAQLLDAHVGAVMVTDAQLELPGPHILYVSSAFTRIFGYAPEEVLGRNPRMFQGPLTDRSVIERLRAALARRESFSGSTINYRKDGSPFTLHWTIAPLSRPGGAPVGYIAYQRDGSRPDVLRDLVAGASALRRTVDLAYLETLRMRPPIPLDGERRKALAGHIDNVAARARLTRREREVLDQLLLGLTHAAIAETLGISARTVKFHQERLFAKLGAESRVDLFRILL